MVSGLGDMICFSNKGSFKYYIISYNVEGSSQSITIDYNLLGERGQYYIITIGVEGCISP